MGGWPIKVYDRNSSFHYQPREFENKIETLGKVMLIVQNSFDDNNLILTVPLKTTLNSGQ